MQEMPLDREPAFDKIYSQNTEELTEYLYYFPFHNYFIHHPPQGFFYIDKIYKNPNNTDVIKSYLLKNFFWESVVYNHIKNLALPNSTVLDIGAHIGIMTLAMSRCVGEQGRVYAFEPQPKLFRELLHNMALNKGTENIIFYCSAVADKEGEIELHPLVLSNEGGTGLGQNYLKNEKGIYSKEAATVPMITIDSLDLQNISLMKIDVEDMENFVLKGARETIFRNKPFILIEICGGWNYDTAPVHIRQQIDDTISLLNSFNYTVKRIAAHDYLGSPRK